MSIKAKAKRAKVRAQHKAVPFAYWLRRAKSQNALVFSVAHIGSGRIGEMPEVGK